MINNYQDPYAAQIQQYRQTLVCKFGNAGKNMLNTMIAESDTDNSSGINSKEEMDKLNTMVCRAMENDSQRDEQDTRKYGRLYFDNAQNHSIPNYHPTPPPYLFGKEPYLKIPNYHPYPKQSEQNSTDNSCKENNPCRNPK